MCTMALRALPLLLSVLAAGAESLNGCSGAWENCSESMCCNTPYFACVEKNQQTTHDGEFVPAYAQCRNANNTQQGCPCQNPPCIDYASDYKLKVKLPWSCTVLTGGCSPAFKPCGPGKNLDADAKKNYQGKPCCMWGCTCDYTEKWAAQCKPPNGSYACTKDAEKKVRMKQEEGLFSIIDGGKAAAGARRGGSLPWLAAAACAGGLAVSAAALVLRKRLNHGLLQPKDEASAEAGVGLQEEALVE